MTANETSFNMIGLERTSYNKTEGIFNVTNFKQASFNKSEAIFNETNLEPAIVINTKLKQASYNKSEAIFNGTNLEPASFNKTSFNQTFFNATNLDHASFSNTSLGQASFDEVKTRLCRTRLVADRGQPYMTPETFANDACLSCLPHIGVEDGESRLSHYSKLTLTGKNEAQLWKVCQQENIDEETCIRWQDCCKDAFTCCQDQLRELESELFKDVLHCPGTWDGTNCYPATMTGTSAQPTCSGSAELISKNCSEEGLWPQINGTEISSPVCFQRHELWDTELMIAKVVCEIISVISLSISIFLLIYCRKLYKSSQRATNYQLHAYLFIAMLLYAICCLIGEAFAYGHSKEGIYFKPWRGCRITSMMIRFTFNFAYSAMSAEAFYLHWNVVQTYRPIRNPIVVMIVAFVLPFFINFIYVVVRLTVEDNDVSCWIMPFVKIEWLTQSFNRLCLALDFILLFNLFRVIYQLNKRTSTFPVDGKLHSPFRRTLKNGDFQKMLIFTLIFGIPLIMLIFPPSYHGRLYMIYRIGSNSLQMLQGTLASMVFILFNKEVHKVFKETPLGKKLFCLGNVKPTETPSTERSLLQSPK